MTVSELRECLLKLRWSANDLADEAHVKDTVVRRWISGADPIPEPIAYALFTLAAFHDQHPIKPKEDPDG